MATSVTDGLHGGLLGTALGDAVGAPFEGRARVSEDEITAWLDADRPLRWTDDTHMALALARTLRDQGDALDPERLGDAFAAAYAAEPWRGYGAGPPQVFALARRGWSYVEAAASLFGGSGSFGNGAAMRVAPVALATGADPTRAAELATVQARVTHTHPEAVDGAVLIATAVCALAASATDQASALRALTDAADGLPGRTIGTSVRRVLEAEQADVEAVARRIGTGVAARESVPAAVAAVLAGHDLVSTLMAAVRLGGDTDTIAAMAGAMAGARYGASTIPEELLTRLEAREQLADLARTLTAG
ncbi:MAG: ADP-ribosylglycohydrolase family protein [Nitriliruptoraceae bacterium]